MRRWRGVWLAGVITMMGVGPAAAQTTAWVNGSPVQTRLVVGQNGDTYVGVWIQAPNDPRARTMRAPMAVSLVIDTSGSMAGDKIESARMAAGSLLETMVDGDIVSIYGFNTTVTEFAPPTVLAASTRSHLMQRINGIYAAGGTNLWDGMQSGIARVAQATPSHPVRRVFLISDGLANVGPSDPVALGNLAAGATEWGMQITAIGVGVDYDQRTLQAMAVRSSGRLYHLTQPQQLATILEQEMSLLSRSVAVNAVLTIDPGPGVTFVEAETLGLTLSGGRLRLPLGAVYAGQSREVLFRARVNTAEVGQRPLAQATLSYQRPGEDEARTEATAIRYEVTRDRGAAQASQAPRVAAMVAQHQASQAQMRASDLMLRGDGSGAARELDRARTQLETAARAAPAAPSSTALRARAARMSAASGEAQSAPPAAMRERAYQFSDEAASAEGY